MAPKNNDKQDELGAEGARASVAENTFILEDIFEDVTNIFSSHRVKEASDNEAMVAIDTNVLLLPYTIRKDRLPKLQEIYAELRKKNRLFLPARVAREFIVHRDKKLAELLKTLSDVKSRIFIGETKLSPILDGVEGSDDMTAASEALVAAKKQYVNAVGRVENAIRSWAGDDPVSNVYADVFDTENIVSLSDKRQDLLEEWDRRQKNRIPPGYKDSSKEDTGIGDFLVWKSLLQLGSEYERDLIFVTGDEKADWFIRVNGGGAFPRPELIAEYRKHSKGKNLRLASLHDLLREMDVSADFADEIETAEHEANTSLLDSLRRRRHRDFRLSIGKFGATYRANFSTKYGGGELTFESEPHTFSFHVSEKHADATWIYPNSSAQFLKLPDMRKGEIVTFDDYPIMHEPFDIDKGEIVALVDTLGNSLLARLEAANIPSYREPYELIFVYRIYSTNSIVAAP